MSASDTLQFMRELEREYQIKSGCRNRSEYKIFYGQIRPAPILVLGINPGGSPERTSPDGLTHLDGAGNVRAAAASATFYEAGTQDLLDCVWAGNTGLLKMLRPLFDNNEINMRRNIVQTNLAFRRSAKKLPPKVERLAMDEAEPFLRSIILRTRPSVVFCTGRLLDVFAQRFGTGVTTLIERQVEPSVKQTVIAASRIAMRDSESGLDFATLAIEIAHPSQFSWVYERHNLVARVRELLAKEKIDIFGAPV